MTATHQVRNAGRVDDPAGFGLGSDEHPGTKADFLLVRFCPSGAWPGESYGSVTGDTRGRNARDPHRARQWLDAFEGLLRSNQSVSTGTIAFGAPERLHTGLIQGSLGSSGASSAPERKLIRLSR